MERIGGRGGVILGSKFLHTRIRVRDMERSVRFYTEVFGLRERGRSTSPRGSQLVFLVGEDGGSELELAYLPWAGEFRVEEDVFHLAFSVEDMREALARMQELGVKITEDPWSNGSGGRFGFIEDPDGYEIEIIETR